jgi:hypothetical protein
MEDVFVKFVYGLREADGTIWRDGVADEITDQVNAQRLL